ncbi:hypothetical protein [Polyangium sp. 6x1]|uniref:hypothetical protein n=1 Tax=Polyangium sp. 6x1 TaxID=3042689 RepID=UPI0024822094|nr:hypothetical protein [Polyangium sp. 6x1]MDI1444330.1 hypothetical protein [Polyangium sp. 6x1]
MRVSDSARLPHFIVCLIAPLAFLACASSTSSTAAPTSPGSAKAQTGDAAPEGGPQEGEQSFTFGWKVPCRVPVEQLSDKKGTTARLRYMLSVKPGADGNLDLTFSDFQFLELNGQDITGPELQKQLAPALAMTSAMPSLIVSREGEYLGVRGLDEMIERILAMPSFNKDPKIAPKVAAMMRSPAIKASLEAKMGDYWNGWVGAWNGLSLAPGASREDDDSIEVGDEEIPTRVRVENHGPVDGAKKLVRLSLVSTMSGTSASAGLAAFTRSLMRGAGTDLSKNLNVERVNRVITLDVETDPATLRPRRARYVMELEMMVNGQMSASRETREERFDWEHAEGCR